MTVSIPSEPARMPEPARGALKALLVEQLAAGAGRSVAPTGHNPLRSPTTAVGHGNVSPRAVPPGEPSTGPGMGSGADPGERTGARPGERPGESPGAWPGARRARLAMAACGVVLAGMAATAVATSGGPAGASRTVAADCHTAPAPARGAVVANAGPAAQNLAGPQAQSLARASTRVLRVNVRVSGGQAGAVRAVIARCERAWRTGAVDGVTHAAGDLPRLVACRTTSGTLAVYPGGDATCRHLGLVSA